MRIAVNTRLFLKDKLEGIGWFAHETLSRIVRQHPEHEFIFFFDRPYHEDFVFGPNVTPVVLMPQARHPALYYLWSEWSVPRALKKYKADVYLVPDGLGSISTQVPVCLVIHDLAYKHYPEFMDKLHQWHYAYYTPRFAAHAKRIVAVSEYTRKDIAHQFNIEENKIDVVYNGAHQAYKPVGADVKQAIKDQYTDGEEFFLFTGALQPRKNIVNLLKAFVQFKRRQRSKIKLVIVGRMAWQSKEIAKAKELMPYREDVVWTGYLDVSELSRITASAYALVYPSLFEGFGIPILEAMYCDVPVIVSNSSSMPEVGGPAALLVDPASPEDIAAKMMQLYKDEALRDKLIVAARIHREQFTWDLAAQKLWESLMKCIS